MNSEQSKVFVGGIPWETTEERLKDYFRAFGDVVEAVIMKDRATGRARGFGFVEFADTSVVERVLTEKHTVDGRSVEVKKAVRKEEQHNTSRSNISISSPVSTPNTVRTKKIFVGGLPSTVTEEDFRSYFGQFGTITDVVVMYDHTTQRPRGFGFITYDSEEAVENAVQKSFHELHEKTVEVKRAVPKELSGGRGGGGGGYGGARSSPYGGGYGQANSSSPIHSYGYGPIPPGGRGGYPYGPPYGAPPTAYGPNMSYGMAMNGGYGYAVGYGGAPPPPGYMGGYGAPSPGYGAGLRSPWGSGSAGYGVVAGMSSYGSGAWTSTPGGVAQSPAGAGGGGYNNGIYGYGGGDGRGGGGAPHVVGYGGDGYGSSAPYSGDSSTAASWRSSEQQHAGGANSGSGGGGGGSLSPTAGGATDVGYSIPGRPATQRGPEARFRPYPSTGERVA